jgi:3-isopropylmalate dehydrogenase
VLPDDELEILKGCDSILLGAVGDPRVKPGILERDLLLRIRFELDQYVNLRPVVRYPGVQTLVPSHTESDVDFVVVRENTEGLYAGAGGILRKGTPQEVAIQASVNTRFGVERVVRFAFSEALKSGRRRHVTLVHKTNVLNHAGDLWARVFEEVAAEYPEVGTGYCHVDAACIYFLDDPARFDVIVTDNLFGDILTDLAAAVTGGIGLAASGNINPDRRFPSMFEPVHGSAPDIADKGIADPTATILSVALLLNHCGLPEEAARIERAVTADIEARTTGEARTTSEIGDAIASAV